MRRRAHLCAIAIVAVAASLHGGALVASADEDPPFIRSGDPPIRPPSTSLRATQIDVAPDAPPAYGPVGRRVLVVVIGGYGSEYKSPAELEAFAQSLRTDPRYDVRIFGDDPKYRYDTYGPLDDNARTLTAQVRALGPRYSAVHIVAHSMGGNVADRAFAQGLSANDGVRTYVALSVPHDGSLGARLAQWTLDRSGPARPEVNAMGRHIGFEADTAAARDLATVRAGPPSPGITRLDIRMATDALVGSDDARDLGVASRVLLPSTVRSIEGHGGALADPRSIELVRQTIATGVVPPASTSRVSAKLAEGVSKATDAAGLLFFLTACSLCACAGMLEWARRRARPLRPLM